MGREIISKSIQYNGTPTLSALESLITTYINNGNLDTGWTQLGSILILMLRYVNSVSGGGGGLVDGVYGDITISGGGTIINYNANSVNNSDMAEMPAFTLKGNDSGTSATPQNLTVPETQVILSIDDLIALNGIAEGVTNLGNFTGTGLPNLNTLTIKQAFQALKDIIVLATTTVNGFMSANDFGKLAIQTLADAATVTWNANNGNYALLTIGANRTLAAPTNIGTGELYVLNVTASGADRTLTFNSIFKGLDGSDLGAITILSGTSRAFAFQMGPTNLHQIGGNSVGGSVTGESTYSAGSGMIVTATGLGVTFVRISAFEWIVTIPDGVDIKSGYIYNTTAQNPGANCYIKFIYNGTRPFNTNTAGTDARPPVRIWGVNMAGNGDGATVITRTNFQQYAVTTGATNLLPRITEVGSGDIEIEIANYTTALGSAASIVMFNF
jgi:hypothetical protein